MQSFMPLAVKVIVAGQGGVGKSTMLARLESGKFLPQATTVGVNFVVRPFTTPAGEIVCSIWDYAGEERFKALFPGYATGAAGAVACFDVTRQHSLEGLSDWIVIIKDRNPEGVPIFLVGCKADTATEDQLVFVRSIAGKFNTSHELSGFYLTSSKTGDGVTQVFENLMMLIGQRMQEAGE